MGMLAVGKKSMFSKTRKSSADHLVAEARELRGRLGGVLVKIARPIVRRYVQNLRANRIRPHGVYLFGSYVSGSATEDSDIDVAVVSEDLPGNVIEDAVLLRRYCRDIDLRIEPHPFRPEDFTPDNPWVAEIIRTGIKIV